jgi:hypothetical protein
MSTRKWTLSYIIDRSVINDETGCWEWSMALQGRVPVCDIRAAGCSSACKAAWLLSGRKLEPGHVVWRHACGNHLCVNPAHMKAGTRSEMRKACGESGRERGSPERAATNRKTLAALAVPAHVVAELSEQFAAGAMTKDIRAATGFSKKTLAKIRAGRHINSPGRCVRAASVFSWGQ